MFYLVEVTNITLATLSRIGRQETLKTLTVGLIIVYLLITFIISSYGDGNPFLWITRTKVPGQVLVSTGGMYVAAWMVSPMAASLINRQLYAGAVGLLFAFLILWLGFIVGFLFAIYTEVFLRNHSLESTWQESGWMLFVMANLFGGLPVTIAGIWLGHAIKDRLDAISIHSIENK